VKQIKHLKCTIWPRKPTPKKPKQG